MATRRTSSSPRKRPRTRRPHGRGGGRGSHEHATRRRWWKTRHPRATRLFKNATRRCAIATRPFVIGSSGERARDDAERGPRRGRQARANGPRASASSTSRSARRGDAEERDAAANGDWPSRKPRAWRKPSRRDAASAAREEAGQEGRALRGGSFKPWASRARGGREEGRPVPRGLEAGDRSARSGAAAAKRLRGPPRASRTTRRRRGAPSRRTRASRLRPASTLPEESSPRRCKIETP